VTIGLPSLEIFFDRRRPAWADDGPVESGFPKRFGLFFWGNGNIPARWTPKIDGPDWEETEQLAPLMHLRDMLTIVSGMHVKVPNTVPHFAGAAGCLSGSPVMDAYGENTMATPSIDQVIAAELGQLTRFASLEFGAAHGSGLSFNGPSSKNPPEGSPFALFERVFGGSFQLPGEEPIVDPTIALRRSVLDVVGEQATALMSRVGHNDKVRLEQHFDGIRSLEQRLARLEEDPPNLASCALPTVPEAEYPDFEGRPQLAAKNKAFAEIAAMALACDQTRVFSNWFTYPVSNHLFPGAAQGHHKMTHDEGDPQPEVHKIIVQCVEAMAAQFDALQAIPEGDGTLLDSCAVLGTSDVSFGKTHSLEDFPLVIAGSAGGKLVNGTHYHSPAGENVSKVMLSLARAVGLDLAAFGSKTGEATEGLGAIEV